MKKQLINVIESGSIFCYNFGNWGFAKNTKYPKLFKNLVNNAILTRMDYYKGCMDAEEQVTEDMEDVAWVGNLSFKDQGLLLKKLYLEMNTTYDDSVKDSEIHEDYYLESFLQWVIKDALESCFAYAIDFENDDEDDDKFFTKTSKLWIKVLASGLDIPRIDIKEDILDGDFSWFEYLFYDSDFEFTDTSCEDNRKYAKSLKEFADVEISSEEYVELV